MKAPLEFLARKLAGKKDEVLLIGGHALAAYGVLRQTLDVDFIIAEETRGSLKDILCRAGYEEKVRTGNFSRFTHTVSVLVDVDIIFVEMDTFKKMLKESVIYRPVNGRGNEFRVPSLKHLISLKLHAVRNQPDRKYRDKADIIELLQANPGGIPGKELEIACLKYGPEGVFKELEEYL